MINLGSTWFDKSLGMGRDDRKPLEAEGTVDDDENNLLYEDRLPWLSRGDLCGEL